MSHIDYDAKLLDREVAFERGLTSVIESGKALDSIREERLYRNKHETWDEYLRARWNMSTTAARRYINAARVASFIAQEAPGLPAIRHSRTALKLMTLKDHPDRLVEAYSEAVVDNGGKAPSAPQVEKAIDRVAGSCIVARRAQERRNEWADAKFRSETPKVSISLDPEDAILLARFAKESSLDLSEACRHLVTMGLRMMRPMTMA
jgi:hypothetical protein